MSVTHSQCEISTFRSFVTERNIVCYNSQSAYIDVKPVNMQFEVFFSYFIQNYEFEKLKIKKYFNTFF